MKTKQEIEEDNKKIKEQKEQFFIDENEQKRVEALTPSGRFKLVIRYYSTKEGCWNYSRGTIYNLDDEEICDVKRNYSSFHHSFINKDKCEWLITGRSYMSQTIVNLDTGEIFEPSGDQYKGSAFCWAGEILLPDKKTLMVEGCYWAAPYEYKFFDFSNPAEGWSELEIWEDGEKSYLCQDQGDYPKAPLFNEDGSITIFETSDFYLPLNKYENQLSSADFKNLDSDMDDDKNWRTDIDQKITLRREGDKMKIISRWLSQTEKDRIAHRKIANDKYKQWEKDFKASDELYLEYKLQLQNPILIPESYESRGITYENWCPFFDKEETRWCRRIVKKNDSNPYTIDLAWAVKTGPIKLSIYRDGKKLEDKFFKHTAEEMDNAFLYVHDLISE